MASKGDKLSPLLKSLRPDGSHLASAAAVAVQEAEQRWPLFRAIAPTKPAPAPELTEGERLHWSNPVISVATATQHKLALAVPGLNEQLAEGLNKMAGSKPNARRSNNRAKAQKSEQPKVQTNKLLNADAKKDVQEQPKAFRGVLGKMTSDLPNTSLTASTQEESLTTAPVPVPVPVPARIETVSNAPSPEPALNAPKHPTKSTRPTPKGSESKPPQKQEEPRNKKTTSKSESLKTLFGRLELPKEPEPKVQIKKSSFLGRLSKR